VDEKRFLAVLLWFSSQTDAARYIGVRDGRQWLKDHKRRDPEFRAAVEERRWTSMQLARRFGLDLLGIAMEQLTALVSGPETSDGVRLRAIELVMKLNNVGQEQAPVAPVMQQQTFVYIKGGRSAERYDQERLALASENGS
jgi:hypothetical protein